MQLAAGAQPDPGALGVGDGFLAKEKVIVGRLAQSGNGLVFIRRTRNEDEDAATMRWVSDTQCVRRWSGIPLKGVHVKFLLKTIRNTSPAAALLLLVSWVGASNAAVLEVSNCNDGGSSVTDVAAASGDTTDLTHITCSRINLASGQVINPEDDLRLVGRSRDALTIDGGLHGRVLWHRGGGRHQSRDQRAQFVYDGRGPGYPRVKGTRPDIGAVEF